MAQTFDIRFARSAGLAAMLEVPANGFRWRGGGLLSIDAQGISIGVKRGLLALLGSKRTQRIPSENLRAVYREGEALRVEFQTGETARVVLPFWADSREAAEQIVRLLPTSQTVEMEHVTHSTKPRADWRLLSSFGLVLAAIAAGTWTVYQRNNLNVTVEPVSISDAAATVEKPVPTPTTTPSPASSAQNVETSAKPAQPAPWYEAPAIPLDPYRSAQTRAARPASAIPAETTALPASTIGVNRQKAESTPRPRDVRVTSEGIVPYVPGMPEYVVARRQLDLFLAEANTLRGHTSPENGWWMVTVRIYNSPDFKNPELKPLQEIELAVSGAWRRAYSMRASGEFSASAPAEFEFAEMLEARANEFVQ
ncbi:MAG TPA: hypothetical protein VFS58_10630 [Steroidobacteraceae bacterium]|nr:hypothetical protein [Steroidobacteraceae bacterium]